MSNYSQVPQQGGEPYPPQSYQQGGYPAPGQQAGYPPPAGQGYPPAGQGYPPQGQGYPPQGQPTNQGGVPRYAGEMPHEDIRDDPNMKPPTAASAPPPEIPHTFPGYSLNNYNEALIPPPAYVPSGEAPHREAVPEFVNLTQEGAKGALTEFVAENCCYGKAPAEELVVTEIVPSSAYHYSLESFCEERSTKWESEPYYGGPIYLTGPPPGPWEVSVPQPELFKDKKTKVEVPNTAIVKPCHHCYGRGFDRCWKCHGRGMLQCNLCDGSGFRTDAAGETSQCMSCDGAGRKSCYTCDGFGQTKCVHCNGHGQLKWFIQLTVKWKNHDDDHVVERTSLPPKLIKDVAGKTVLSETGLRVYPVNHFPDQEINAASNELVLKHTNKYLSERMLQQRHNLRIVPVNSVSYTIDDKVGTFHVYGMENKVYFPDYPAQCCCGCSIL